MFPAESMPCRKEREERNSSVCLPAHRLVYPKLRRENEHPEGKGGCVCARARQQALALTYKYKTPPAPTLTTVKFFGFSSYTLDFVVGAVSLRLWPLLMPSKNPSSFRRMAIGERGESGCDGTSLCVLLWCRSRVGGLPNCAVSFWRLRAIVPFSIMLSH